MKETIKFSNIILILIVVAIVYIGVMAQSTTSTPKNAEIKVSGKEVTLEAKLSSNKFQFGGSVELTLTITNKTDLTVVLFDVEPERGFDIKIKDANGISLPLTEEGRKGKYSVNIVRRETVFLESGKQLTLPKKIRLDEIFDLKRTGNYTLDVERIYYLQETSSEDMGLKKDGVLSSKLKFIIE